jgi:hypothetical protein
LRVTLLVTWAVAVIGSLGAWIALLVTGDGETSTIVLIALSVPGGVAVCAITHPGGLARFQSAAYRSFIGVWTTLLVTVAANAVVALIGSIALRSAEPWAAALVFSGAIAAGNLGGWFAYFLVGELLVSVVLVSTAKLRGVRPPLDRLAAGLIFGFLIALVPACVGSAPDLDSTGSTSRGHGLAILLIGLTRFEGPADQVALAWVARACVLGVAASVLWLFELRARGVDSTRPSPISRRKKS